MPFVSGITGPSVRISSKLNSDITGNFFLIDMYAGQLLIVRIQFAKHGFTSCNFYFYQALNLLWQIFPLSDFAFEQYEIQFNFDFASLIKNHFLGPTGLAQSKRLLMLKFIVISQDTLDIISNNLVTNTDPHIYFWSGKHLTMQEQKYATLNCTSVIFCNNRNKIYLTYCDFQSSWLSCLHQTVFRCMSQDKIKARITDEQQDFLKIERDLQAKGIGFSFKDCAKYRRN